MNKFYLLFFSIIVIIIITASANAGVSKKEITTVQSSKDKNDIERVIPLIDTRQTTLSQVVFNVTTNGANAHLAPTGSQGEPGLYWPRNSSNSYIYGMGLCFSARKYYNNDTNKLVEMSYNPTSAKSWLIPGRIEDGNPMIFGKKDKYQIYMSTDYNKATGAPLDVADTLLWPLWKQDNNLLNRFGQYVFHNQQRTVTDHSNGPAFISDEDMICQIKDTDISRYEGDRDLNQSRGFPLKMQYEESIYSWGIEKYKDMIIVMYNAINMSTDTLWDCWFSQIVDPDIVIKGNSDTTGMKNDQSKLYTTDNSLNLGITWSDTTAGEKGKGMGYVGVSLLMTPTTDQNGFIKKDKRFYPPNEQLGLKSFILFPIMNDSIILNNLYDNIASGTKTEKLYPTDIRLLFSTGPFHLYPGDTARMAVLVYLANTAGGGDATGTDEDCKLLVDGVKEAHRYFYQDLLVAIENQENDLNNRSTINSIYPNPAIDYSEISFNTPKPGSAIIEIINLSGRVLESENIILKEGTSTFKVNTGNLSNGTYIINVKSKDFNSGKLLTVYK